MASSTINDLMKAYIGSILGYTPAQLAAISIDTLMAQFYASGPPYPAAGQYATGTFYGVSQSQALSTFIFGGNGEVRYIPFFCEKPMTLSDYAVEVSTGGGAGSLGRMGIFAMKNDGLVGTLVDDGGTFATTGTGALGVTGRAAKLTPGWYFIAVAQQGSPTPNMTVRSFAGTFGPTQYINLQSAVPFTNATGWCSYITNTPGTPGAFASNPTVALITGSSFPRYQFKIASLP